MSDRKAVLLLMFDLPSVDNEDHREYYHFMKTLRQNGFLQLQKSCYLKLVRNVSSMNVVIESLRGKMPKQGSVSVLPLNLKDFAGMRCLCGEAFDMVCLRRMYMSSGTEKMIDRWRPIVDNKGTNSVPVVISGNRGTTPLASRRGLKQLEQDTVNLQPVLHPSQVVGV